MTATTTKTLTARDTIELTSDRATVVVLQVGIAQQEREPYRSEMDETLSPFFSVSAGIRGVAAATKYRQS